MTRSAKWRHTNTASPVPGPIRTWPNRRRRRQKRNEPQRLRGPVAVPCCRYGECSGDVSGPARIVGPPAQRPPGAQQRRGAPGGGRAAGASAGAPGDTSRAHPGAAVAGGGIALVAGRAVGGELAHLVDQRPAAQRSAATRGHAVTSRTGNGALKRKDAMPAHGPLIAAIQMCSGADVAANLEQARHLVEAAVARGAGLVALPENFSFMGMDERAKLEGQEREGAGAIQEFLAHTARQHRIWLVAGSVPLQASVADKVRASCLVYDDGGQLKARYDKIHLFGFEIGEERYFEARTIEPGDAIVVVDSPFGRLGLSICYDLRFPELYRAMQGIDIVLVPSAFTETTGRAHWETLLRARAIDNLVYVLATASP